MGLFSRIAGSVNHAFGGADPEVMEHGTLGLGVIAALQPSGGTVQIMGGLVERTCTMQIKVILDGGRPYFATVTQRVPEAYLAQLGSGSARVAVRVDPQHPEKVAIDLRTQPPVVRLAHAEGPGTAAYILEHGRDAVVVMVEFGQSGWLDWRGFPLYDFILTVAEGAPQPYQLQAGNAVPPEALPLLYPGSRLHAKIGDQPNQVVVDFARGAAPAAASA